MAYSSMIIDKQKLTLMMCSVMEKRGTMDDNGFDGKVKLCWVPEHSNLEEKQRADELGRFEITAWKRLHKTTDKIVENPTTR